MWNGQKSQNYQCTRFLTIFRDANYVSQLVCFSFQLLLDYNPISADLNFLLLKPYFLSFGCVDAFHNLISYAKGFMTAVLFNNI